MRQTVRDVICAYLRMPYTPTPAGAEELLVRKTAPAVLTAHLRDEDYLNQRAADSVPASFWPQVRAIDLTGAHLVDFNLSHCRTDNIEFNHAVLDGESLFRGLACDLAFFQGTVFHGHADFRSAVFANSAWFSYATFGSDVWFRKDEFYPGASFGRHAAFKHVTFGGTADFTGAVFGASAEFEEAIYQEGADAIVMKDARTGNPDAISPEITGAPTTWPPGWAVQATPGSGGTLVRRAQKNPFRAWPWLHHDVTSRYRSSRQCAPQVVGSYGL